MGGGQDSDIGAERTAAFHRTCLKHSIVLLWSEESTADQRNISTGEDDDKYAGACILT